MRLLLFRLATTPPSGSLLHAGDFFVQPHGDAMVAQVVGERLDDFGIGEFQQARPLLHQDHAHAQDREHAGVLHADDAAAHHDQGLAECRASAESGRC